MGARAIISFRPAATNIRRKDLGPEAYLANRKSKSVLIDL
jgi:hypothetical protein